jgi:hypothetical protein
MSDSLAAPSSTDTPSVTLGGAGVAGPAGSSSYVAGALLGGTTMSVLSAAGTLALEKKKPTPKTLARDFILGAILLLFILQLLPESTGKLISYVTSLVAVPTVLAAAMPSMSAAAALSDDVEVKVGVPRF